MNVLSENQQMIFNQDIPSGFLKYETTDELPNSQLSLEGRHKVKEGCWGQLVLTSGLAVLEFLGVESEPLFEIELELNEPVVLPPFIYYRVMHKSDDVTGEIGLYCHPDLLFHHKYQLTKTHSEVVNLNQNILPFLSGKAQSLDILDMGCGRGRNSLYLAQQGHNLNSVDIDEKQLATLCEIIQQERIGNIITQCVDLEQFVVEDKFDLVLLNVVLQFLNRGKLWSVIEEAKRCTRAGGLHLIVAPVETLGMNWPNHFHSVFKPGELLHSYRSDSWAILEYNEDFGNLHRLDAQGLPIRGRFATLIAQKVFNSL